MFCLPGRSRELDTVASSLAWFDLPTLPPWLRDIDTLRSFEGRVAVSYFSAFVGLPLRWRKGDVSKIPPHWRSITERTSNVVDHRSARNATNPFHAALNLAYSVCSSACTQALNIQGFDTSCGILHADKAGRDSLTYDLIEPFRGLIDDKLLNLFDTLQLCKGDISESPNGSVRLSPHVARYVIERTTLPQTAIDKAAYNLKMSMLQ